MEFLPDNTKINKLPQNHNTCKAITLQVSTTSPVLPSYANGLFDSSEVSGINPN